MLVEETNFDGLRILKPKVHGDKRGFFLEAWREDISKELTLPHFVQDNHAFSSQAGIFRGMHFQKNPSAQAKLVWVTNGAVLDIVIDIRKSSNTYGKVYSIILSAENFKRFFVPQGFAHGYLTLEANTHFHYKVDNYYSAQDEGGISYKSKELNINFADFYKGDIILSEKDKELPLFENFESFF